MDLPMWPIVSASDGIGGLLENILMRHLCMTYLMMILRLIYWTFSNGASQALTDLEAGKVTTKIQMPSDTLKARWTVTY